MKRVKSVWSCIVTAIVVLVVLAGCSHYYRVTDPSTGKTYYTTDITKRSSGAIELKDNKSGNEVTLQNSEVEEIEKEEFNQNLYSK